MSKLSDLRKAAKAALLRDGLWSDGQVIIKRRTDIWNAISTAMGANRDGQVIVIATVVGDTVSGRSDRSKTIEMELTLIVSLFEKTQKDPAVDDDEDARWEETLIRLQGDPLDRAATHYGLGFQSFKEVPDEVYLHRQAIFTTKFHLP